jgi:hypothetical protein
VTEHLIERMTWPGIVAALVPRIVQVCREMTGKE